MPDRAADDNVDALHRNAAARTGIAFDHHQPAMAGGRGRLRSIASDADDAGHDVLREPRSSMTIDRDRRLLVHAGAVVADMAFDLDLNRAIDADGYGMGASRVKDAPKALIGFRGQLVHALVERAHADDAEIEVGHGLNVSSSYRPSRAQVPRWRPSPHPADLPGRDIPWPSPPIDRSRQLWRVCRRSDRAARRSRAGSRSQRYKSRRDRPGLL